MTCALATASGVLWLCLVRPSVVPGGVRPALARKGATIAARVIGLGILVSAVACWVAQSGVGIGLSRALVAIMLVGAGTVFLLPRAPRLLFAMLLASLLGSGIALAVGDRPW